MKTPNTPIGLSSSWHPILLPLFLCISFCSYLSAQPVTLKPRTENRSGIKLSLNKEKLASDIELEWRAPAQNAKFIKAYKRINLEVRARSPFELDDTHLIIFVNEDPLGQKSGEAPLVIDPREKIFRATVDLTELGRYSIRAEVDYRGQRQKTETIFVESIDSPPDISIVWTEPEVLNSDRTYVHGEAQMEVRAIIDAKGTALTEDNIQLYFDGAPLLKSNKSSLRKLNGNRYRFSDVIVLNNSGDAQQSLSLRIIDSETRLMLAESDIIKVSYSPLKKPNLYVLSIGTQTNLRYTVKDAVDFAQAFEKQDLGNALYNTVTIDLLQGKEASAYNIKKAIERLETRMETREIQPNDLIILFISSHGFMLDGQFRIQGNDFESGVEKSTSVSFDHDIMEHLENMSCKKLVFVDACHSGGAFDPSKGGKASSFEVANAIEELNRNQSGHAIFASCGSTEISYEDQAWRNGAFTEAILRAVKDARADYDKNQLISIRELEKYVTAAVPVMVKKEKGKDQNPRLYTPNNLRSITFFVTQ